MRGKLPWWLVVILGWIVIFAAGKLFLPAAAVLRLAAKDTPGLLGGAWYMVLLAGAVIALALVVAIVRVLVVLASSHQRESIVLIFAAPFLLLLYKVLTWLPALLRR
jgi:hypothetical protein